LDTLLDHSPAQIVLIEDNRVDASLLRQALDTVERPYTLQVLIDADEAWRFIEASGKPGARPPDLIILDLHLPKTDGITILEKLRCSTCLSEVPIAVLPTLASPLEERRVREMGVRLYRIKPLDWNDTMALAQELMDICREARVVSEQ